MVSTREKGTSEERLLDSQKPPTPIEIAPAMSSATPPRTTMRELPIDDKPAVRAKGTVKPSERPMILSLNKFNGVSVLLLSAFRHSQKS